MAQNSANNIIVVTIADDNAPSEIPLIDLTEDDDEDIPSLNESNGSADLPSPLFPSSIPNQHENATAFSSTTVSTPPLSSFSALRNSLNMIALSNDPSFLLSGNLNPQNGGIIGSVPLNIPLSLASTPTKPAKHECFGKKFVTAAEFSKDCDVHHVNRKDGVLASTWKLRCKDCTEDETIVDITVGFVFCFLTTQEREHCFMVTIKSIPTELFLIRASDFLATCPLKYTLFYQNINSYNSLLADLAATIEEQKKIVERSFECDLLQPYKINASVDISKLPGSSDAQKAASEIRRLFFLELEYEMGEFMRRNINFCNELNEFVMDYHKNRDESYAIITKEDVQKTCIALFDDLVNQS